jgi:hypothetical protein
MSKMRDKLRYHSLTATDEHKGIVEDDELIYMSVFLIAGIGLILSLLFWTY